VTMGGKIFFCEGIDESLVEYTKEHQPTFFLFF
jgi:hypothetical protein